MQRAASNQWKQQLAPEVIERIFHYTQRHPYYVNLLCSKLWQQDTPTIMVVDAAWQKHKCEERSQVSAELDLLSRNQRKLLTVLARYGATNEPRSLAFTQQAKMSGATITQALRFLEKKDYLFRDDNGYYHVLDPLIKSVLAEL